MSHAKNCLGGRLDRSYSAAFKLNVSYLISSDLCACVYVTVTVLNVLECIIFSLNSHGNYWVRNKSKLNLHVALSPCFENGAIFTLAKNIDYHLQLCVKLL